MKINAIKKEGSACRARLTVTEVQTRKGTESSLGWAQDGTVGTSLV